MSRILHEVLEANAVYSAGFGDKGVLAISPARKFAILTCMDARLDPAKFAGLSSISGEDQMQGLRHSLWTGRLRLR
jgi:hypothetical protein